MKPTTDSQTYYARSHQPPGHFISAMVELNEARRLARRWVSAWKPTEAQAAIYYRDGKLVEIVS